MPLETICTLNSKTDCGARGSNKHACQLLKKALFASCRFQVTALDLDKETDKDEVVVGEETVDDSNFSLCDSCTTVCFKPDKIHVHCADYSDNPS